MVESTRREFLQTAALAGAGVLLGSTAAPPAMAASHATTAVAIASANGLNAVRRAMEILDTGAEALDAVIAGVNLVEDDPNDTSVGYGGLPNEDGVVELDAAVMHGPTHRAGAVAALRNIKNPSKVARVVMERSDHVLLVGEGALRFARAHGFKEEDLLTEKAREIWLRWKETMSTKDDWLPPHGVNDRDLGELLAPYVKHYGTIHCSALDRNGNLACVTTTSGLSFKIPGRVGDSPIVGAGLYCDNAVGSAGSTGRGEANLVNCSSAMIVEGMRQGMTPNDACLAACRRVADHTVMARLKTDDGRPNFDLIFYALSREGVPGGASLHGGRSMAVHDGREARLVPVPSLYPEPLRR